MNPYTLRSVHCGNVGMYRTALAAHIKAANAELFGKLIAMEAALVAETEDLLSELGRLRSAQRALGGRESSHPTLRIV